MRVLGIQVLLGSVALAMLAGPTAAEEILIKRNYEPGKTWYVEQKQEIEQTMSGGPMGSMSMKVTNIMGMLEKAKSAGDGSAVLDMTFDRANYAMNHQMMGELFYDTDQPGDPKGNPMIKQIFDPLIGKTFQLEFTDGGKEVKATGMDAIQEEIAKSGGANPLWKQMQQQFSDQAMANEWGTTRVGMYPNKKIDVGGTWEATTEDEASGVGAVITDTTFTLEKVEKRDGRRVALVKYEGKMRLKDEPTADSQVSELSGSTTGQAVYDIERGIYTSQSSTSKMDLKATPPQMPGQSIDVDLTIGSTTTVMDPEARAKQKSEVMKKAEPAEQTGEKTGEKSE